MRRVEIWLINGDHLVFYNVLLAGPSEKERFFFVRRGYKTDYISACDIRRVTVTDDEDLPVKKKRR